MSGQQAPSFPLIAIDEINQGTSRIQPAPLRTDATERRRPIQDSVRGKITTLTRIIFQGHNKKPGNCPVRFLAVLTACAVIQHFYLFPVSWSLDTRS